MKKLLMLLSILLFACSKFTPTDFESDLSYRELSTTWDEAFPLGNAEIGELVWEKNGKLRISLDHSDIWDLRPFNFNLRVNNYKWIQECVKAGDVKPVQEKMDLPYDREPAPTKLPCAALEFPLEHLGKIFSARLYLHDAVCQIKWDSGISLETFVNASQPVGWFIFRGLTDENFRPQLETPKYNVLPLSALGYEQGKVDTIDNNSIIYHQKGWGDFYYDVAVSWKRDDDVLYGTWSVATSIKGGDAVKQSSESLLEGYKVAINQHLKYWNDFWKASSVCIPDTTLQRQYDREMYKIGSISRENSRPISLQAIWTADDGHLPPWKGDFHNDLNTELCYWPVYTGNHLSEGLAYLNTLWNQRDTYRKYTKVFFGVDGIVVPGVMDLNGNPMGGWVQYTLSSTIGAWCAHHFYLHWKYSADNEFLRSRAYPFINDVAIALDELSVKDSLGMRSLPLSTTPEMYGNEMEAWFRTITNFDLALMCSAFKEATEMASALGLKEDSCKWAKCLSEMPEFDLDADSALTFAHGFPYNQSHRHLSHAMAIFPLGLIDVKNGAEAQKIIKSTIKKIYDYTEGWWCGYSYSWLGNMKARALDGDGAAEALRTFQKHFCLKNGFHVDADLSKMEKYKIKDRPFTLEGNLAFASGIQEMLLQSHTDTICIFPAIPSSWNDVSFSKLRARGAFLVSANMEDGKIVSARVFSEKGGPLDVHIPGDNIVLHFETTAGQEIIIR